MPEKMTRLWERGPLNSSKRVYTYEVLNLIFVTFLFLQMLFVQYAFLDDAWEEKGFQLSGFIHGMWATKYSGHIVCFNWAAIESISKSSEDRRGEMCNLCSYERKAWKNCLGWPGFEPWTLRYRCSTLTIIAIFLVAFFFQAFFSQLYTVLRISLRWSSFHLFLLWAVT